MFDRSFLDWPFFDDAHRRLAAEVDAWAVQLAGSAAPRAGSSAAGPAPAPRGAPAPSTASAQPLAPTLPFEGDTAAQCQSLVRALGEAGFLRYVVPRGYGGVHDAIDVRSICIFRDTLARVSGLADVAFAMQGLGSGPISLFGSEQLRRRYLPRVAAGECVAAFAVSEDDAGSDIAAMQTTARRDGDAWVIDGAKTWISNAGIADFYVVFCRLDDSGDRAFGALVVDAATPGLHVEASIEAIAPHVLGTLRFERCRVPVEQLVGAPGDGLRIALATLDVFRPTVGAAALGLARRALDEATRWVRTRLAFGRPLAEHQMTQARIADMVVAIDASALLVYRAAWAHDRGQARNTREAAIAKLFATEAAQRVVDSAVQLFGGRGIVRGAVVERLYREVRALRIYEGTSEIQKIIIAGQTLRQASGGAGASAS
jgi:acyl-CoA dehydrogenase